MDSKYDQIVEHQLFQQQQQQQQQQQPQQQQQFIQFYFHSNKLLKRKYQCNTTTTTEAVAATATATATSATITKIRRSQRPGKTSFSLSTLLLHFNDSYLTTTTTTTKTPTLLTAAATTATPTNSTSLLTTHNVIDTAHIETHAPTTTITNVHDNKIYTSAAFKINSNGNKINNSKNVKNFYRNVKCYHRRVFYYLFVYVSLLFWLNVKSSVIVIAGSTINTKGHYQATLNGTLNNTLLQLSNSNNNNSPANYYSNNISQRPSESQVERQSSNSSSSPNYSESVSPTIANYNHTTDTLINDTTATTTTTAAAETATATAATTTTTTITSTLSNYVWLNNIPSSISESETVSVSIPIYTINTYTTLTAHVLNETTLSDNIDSIWELPSIQTVCVTIILLFVILGTIVGNILVCIAVCMVRKLRRPCNYLLVSLALSDLCVAVLVMPIALLNEVFEKWNFGPVLCDIWVSFDVLCCTASILNLCAISVDRYLAITKPLEYGVKRTPKRMMICVALVWLAAACISLPPLLILGNEHVDESGMATCTVCQNFAYQIYATLGSFYIPLAVMLFVYYQIFRAARRIVLEEKRAQTHLQHALNGTGSSPPIHTELDYTTGDGRSCSGQQQQQQQQQHRHSSYGNTSLNYGGAIAIAGQRGGGSGSSGLLGSPHHKKLRFQLAKEKKASTTLGIIMSAFTICWLPFFILALIRPFIESESVHVPPTLSSLFLWLGYANSLLNPIIYATLNRDFRKPFQEILYFRCSSLNTMMRENYYQDQYGEPPSQRVMLGDERHGARESFL